MRPSASGATEQRHARRLIEKACQTLDIGFAWPQHRRGRHNPFRNIGIDLHERDIARQNDNRNAALGDGDADGALENLRE